MAPHAQAKKRECGRQRSHTDEEWAKKAAELTELMQKRTGAGFFLRFHFEY